LRRFAAPALVALALVAAACGSSDNSSSDTTASAGTAAAPTTAAPATTGGGETTAPASTPTSGGSDISGDVNWQTDWTIEQAEAYIKAFNEVYPNVNVKYTRSDDAEFVDKFNTEAAAGKVTEDVITIGYDGFAADWNSKGYLMSYASPEAATYPDKYKGKDDSYVVNAETLTGICYNTDVLSSKNIPAPTSWEDLTKPEYKGNMVMQDILKEGSGANAMLINTKGYWTKDGTDTSQDAKWEQYWQAMGQQDITFQPSYTEAQQQLVQGNFAVMPVCYPDYIQPSIDQGAPVKWTAADPVIEVFYALTIPKEAPNPETAKAFFDYSISEAGQNALVSIVGQVPTRPGIAFPETSASAENVPKYPALGTPWSANEYKCCAADYTTKAKEWFGIQ
jgi:iron(III) transport system substrate-binding protein